MNTSFCAVVVVFPVVENSAVTVDRNAASSCRGGCGSFPGGTDDGDGTVICGGGGGGVDGSRRCCGAIDEVSAWFFIMLLLFGTTYVAVILYFRYTSKKRERENPGSLACFFLSSNVFRTDTIEVMGVVVFCVIYMHVNVANSRVLASR